MSSQEPPSSAPSDALGAGATFAYAFASFLRQNEEAWRIRRIDRFRPFDLHLAERKITLQGQIDAELLQRFFELEPEVERSLALTDEQRRPGSPLTVYVPAVAHPKRLHLDFYARDRQGHLLPVVNRFQSARMTAVHLMAVLLGDKDISIGNTRRLLVVLMALAFQTPGGFEERIRIWNRRAEPPLVGAQLLDWVAWEGDTFLFGLGAELRKHVEEYLDAENGAPPDFPLTNVASLERYNIKLLLLHGIRDVLKTLVGLAPPVEPGPPEEAAGREQSRTWFMDASEPSRLATAVREIALEGLDLLTKELHRADSVARGALYTELRFWRSYVPLEIRLGVPFTIELSETYTFGSSLSYGRQLPRFFRGSWQWYPLPIKDAEGVHLEIEIPDPALQLVRKRSQVVVMSSEAGVLLRFPPNRIFGSVSHASERMAHLYSSRMRAEAPHDDSLLPYLRARLKVRLRPSVFLGHLFAALGAVVAAIYVGDSTIPHAIHRNALATDDLRVVATVGALSLTISLWLTAVQHPRPITFKTLAFPRLILYLALAAIIGSFGFYGLSRVFAHNRRDDPPPRTELPLEKGGVGLLAVRCVDGKPREAASASFHPDVRACRPARLVL
jgi:hypothetical protein